MEKSQLIDLVLDKSEKFEEYEPRGYIYRISRDLIESKWQNNQEVTEAVCLLLRIWNNAFYRFGFFNIDDLIRWVENNKVILNEIKSSKILVDDIQEEKYALLLKNIFEEILEITKIPNPKSNSERKFRKSPVGVAKALHLLLPDFFPLWDDAIAKGMGILWSSKSEDYSEKYLECCFKILNLKKEIKDNPKIQILINSRRNILKIIDEFNFVYFTKEKQKDKNREIYPSLSEEQKKHIDNIINKKRVPTPNP